MKIAGIIPARFASTRFPGKPLIDIAGKSMIQRVYEQAKKSKLLSQVVVATDDLRIFNHVTEFGGLAQMTSEKHPSGTDRCAEIASQNPDFEIFINIQGDEPFIDPAQIDLLCQCFLDPEVQLATLVKKIKTAEELNSPSIPKVVLNKNQDALYFSRHPIPYFRDKQPEEWLNYQTFWKHIGIYGYRRNTLLEISQLPSSSLEQAEALEQLRWLENDFPIRVAITELESLAIDTPADLQKALNLLDS